MMETMMKGELSELTATKEPRIHGLLQSQRSVINAIEELTARITRSAERLDGDHDPKCAESCPEAPCDPAVTSRISEHNGDLEKIEHILGVLAERFDALV